MYATRSRTAATNSQLAEREKALVEREKALAKREHELAERENALDTMLIQPLEHDSFTFIRKMKDLIAQCEEENTKENKMNIILEVYQTINSDMNKILQNEGVSKWFKFLCSVFDKIIQFEAEYRNGGWNEINEKLVKKFNRELNLTKKFLLNIIKNYEGFEWRELALKYKDMITALESERPRRNIKRVNYTYMDMIEPEF